MNAYGGVIHFSDNRWGGGSWVFSAIRIRKSADLIPDADIFFIIAVNSFMVQYRKQCFNMFKVTLFIYLCVWKRRGMLFFSPWWGGGVMQFYHVGIGGVNIFFLLRGAVCHPPPAKIYEQSLRPILCLDGKTTSAYNRCKHSCTLYFDITWVKKSPVGLTIKEELFL